MLKEEDKDQPSPGSWKKYSRSVSWSERPPRNSDNPKPLWNSKARACLPPLQPLSIVRPSIEEWPKAGSDDLGVWPNAPCTPGTRSGPVTPREASTSDQPLRVFEFKKDKLAFFDKECSRILDHIYLGSDAIAKNRQVLRKNGITHVLNCVGFVCPEYFKSELVYKTLWLHDNPSEDITSIFYDVFDYFEEVREQGGRVFVHCCQGVSRSTSLVIAYLMWKEGQSFDDAFQLVKGARGVTNPNLGFACQLLQCQKRVHAMPASPSSVLRMYRMAPHSPYDPLHLVPKMLCEPGPDKLDSRGAFIVHIPTALYVWIGKYSSPVMSENAGAAASQIFRYESVKGSISTLKEDEETSEFWDALGHNISSVDDAHRKSVEEKMAAGQRKLDEYDVDFEIFHRALAGGVVPPFPLSETESETCLPARENGWYRLRRKFTSGIMKEFISSSKRTFGVLPLCGRVEDVAPSVEPSTCSSSQCDSPDSFASYVTGSPPYIKEVDFPTTTCDASLSRSPSFSLVDSFSAFLVSKPDSGSRSPSISPSASDNSSSFTFSPSSSNWSDLSFLSAHPSPHGLESKDMYPCKNGSFEVNPGSIEDSMCLDNATLCSQEETVSTGYTVKARDSCLKGGDNLPSLAVRRGHPPPRMILPSIDEASQKSGSLTSYLEDDAKGSHQSMNLVREVSFEMYGQDPLQEATSFSVDYDGALLESANKYAKFSHSDDITNKVAQVAKIAFYKWPSMHKMDMRSEILDSRSIYLVLAPTLRFGTKVADVLYVWIGGDVASNGSHSQLTGNGCKFEDTQCFESVGRNLLAENGFSMDTQIQIVKEGEEPMQLLEHLKFLSQ